MSLEIKVEETFARVSRTAMELHGVSATQILASMGETLINGKRCKITKLIDVETGLEIK